MVNNRTKCLDDYILQVFEDKDEMFYFPVSSQKQARAFITELHSRGIQFKELYDEIGELEQNFNSWRKGISRPGIGNRIIERINRPIHDVLLLDEDDAESSCLLESMTLEEDKVGSQMNGHNAAKKKINNSTEKNDKHKSNADQASNKKEQQNSETLKKNHDNEPKSKLKEDEKAPTQRHKKEKSEENHKETAKDARLDKQEKNKDVLQNENEKESVHRKEIKKDSSQSPQKHSDVSEPLTNSTRDKLHDEDTAVIKQNENTTETSTAMTKQEHASCDIMSDKEQKHIKDNDNETKIIMTKSNNKTTEVTTSPSLSSTTTTTTTSDETSGQLRTPKEDVRHTVSTDEISQTTDDERVKRNDSSAVCDGVEQLSVTKNNESDDSMITETQDKKEKQDRMTELKSNEEYTTDHDEKQREEKIQTAKKEEIVCSVTQNKTETSEVLNESLEMKTTEKKEQHHHQRRKRESKDQSAEETDEVQIVADQSKELHTVPAESKSSVDKETDTIDDSYNSDLDETDDMNPERRALVKQLRQMKNTDEDGPGYVYVFTDSKADEEEHRLKIGCSRIPQKKLQQAMLFNPDIQLVSAVAVTKRKHAFHEVITKLKPYRLDVKGNWYRGSMFEVLQEVMRSAKAQQSFDLED